MTQRLKKSLLQHLPFALVGVLLFSLSGCEKPQPLSYKIPKEDRAATIQPLPSDAPQAGMPGKMEVLPGMQEAAAAAGGITYTTPAGWEELPATGIRKGNFKLTTSTGSAEITILTFPGDVGGRLANINRWRSQIGLAPATADDLPAYTEGYSISNHRGLYVRLEGEKQSILGALLPFHGNTWFFKMIGDTPSVLGNEASMKQLLDSIQLEDQAH